MARCLMENVSEDLNIGKLKIQRIRANLAAAAASAALGRDFSGQIGRKWLLPAALERNREGRRGRRRRKTGSAHNSRIDSCVPIRGPPPPFSEGYFHRGCLRRTHVPPPNWERPKPSGKNVKYEVNLST